MERINPEGVYRSPRISQMVKVGSTLYISGQVARDASGNVVGVRDARTQARETFANLRRCLESQGVGLDHIAKMTTYIVGREHLNDVRHVLLEHFTPETLPTNTMVLVSGLGEPEWLLEIEAIAILPD